MNHQEQIQIEAMRELQKKIPLNDYGLPVGIYRADLLPFHDYEPDHEEASLPHLDAKQEVEQSTEKQSTADQWITADGETIDVPAGELDMEALPATTSQGDLSQEHPPRVAGFLPNDLEKAFVWLHYDEGFPAFQNGQPFWARLDYESSEAYGLFQRYLLMANAENGDPQDARELWNDNWKPAEGTRSLSELALQVWSKDEDIVKGVEKFQVMSQLYYWNMRAKAYDLYKVVQYRKQQEVRAIETQDSHYVMANKLRHRLGKYIEDEEAFWDMMTPKVAIDMLKQLTQMERISAGLPAAGPLNEAKQGSGLTGGQPFELILRQVAQGNEDALKLVHGGEGEEELSDEDVGVLQKAMDDPDALSKMQELIIRIGGGV